MDPERDGGDAMRGLSQERGAVAVFVAITMVVLLGVLGLAVDAGALYQERKELRNGADAAVLAIAEDCALQPGTCNSGTAAATAKAYADRNASDGLAAISGVDLDAMARTVSVHTSTLLTDGGTIFPPFFASVVGFEGTTVHATASAEWGHASSMRGTLPLIISECEFPFGAPLPTSERVITFHDGNNTEPCNAHAGQDTDGDGFLPGGFGWLDTEGPCGVDLTVFLWDWADPGSSPSNGCDPSDLAALVGDEVALPFFIDIDGQGNNGRYLVGGFGLFHVTGYNFGGQFKVNAPCSGDVRCISGFFTSGAIYEGEFGGPDFGIVIVKLTG